MSYGENHLWAAEDGKSRKFTVDELLEAQGRSMVSGYQFYAKEEAERMIAEAKERNKKAGDL